MIHQDTIIQGDTLTVLKTLPDEFVQCVVTSPPYWGLRSYIQEGDPLKPLEQGLESTPEEYVAKMVEVFREVLRILKKDGTLWLNLGSSYAGSGVNDGSVNPGLSKAADRGEPKRRPGSGRSDGIVDERSPRNRNGVSAAGFKRKDLIPIPWMVAMALQAAGWWLRCDIIWAKRSCIPEPVSDRCTKAHEYLFLMAKSEKYYYDAGAIKEPSTYAGKVVSLGEKSLSKGQANGSNKPKSGNALVESVTVPENRNRRSVWTVNPVPFPEAHFATFPPKLIEPCILAGSRVGDLILDPFMGSGTTAVVSANLGRHYLGIELNPEYVAMANRRIAAETGQQDLFIEAARGAHE